MPTLACARAMPMVRTSMPPIASCAPNTCSTRERTFDRIVFARCARFDNGLWRVPLVWIRLR